MKDSDSLNTEGNIGKSEDVIEPITFVKFESFEEIREKNELMREELTRNNNSLSRNLKYKSTLAEEMNMSYGPNFGIQTGQCAVPGFSDIKYKIDKRSREENAKRIEAESRE